MFSYYKNEVQKTVKLAMPIIIGQLGIMLMGLADTIQVGRMNDPSATWALGAAGMANAIYFTIAVIGYIALQVVSPMISKAKAEGDFVKCKSLLFSVVKVALLLALILGSIIALFGVNYEVFKQEAENQKLAVPFLLIIACSILPSFLFSALKSYTDGFSKTSVAMNITLLALLLNILLNHVLINGYWGFPKWGLNGSGVSTLFSRIFMAFALFLYIYLNRAKFNLDVKTNRNYFREILKVGIPSGFQGFFEVATFGMAIVMMGWLGPDQQAAHIVAINLVGLTYMAATGLGAAGGIRVGEELGLKKKPMIYHVSKVAYGVCVAFMGFCAILMFIFPGFLSGLYTKDIHVMGHAVLLIFWGAVFQLFDGVQVISLGLLRGIQDVNIPTLITIFAYWVVGIPASYILGFKFKLDAQGIWMGLTLSLVVSSILLTWRFYNKLNRLKV